ncbi:hypothetical protein DTO006G1_8196 [Penicillium roqueforti]|uniref:uncharacterized protein n=1 Tax=Penicillium roqueforti TaxID=5082 RepID=UPI00190B222C|nr:uncharacterized protein LCP9604111_8846 [Penicillium roqueforti]KAF9240368.1 hypothetical protein LCP9604111_8846 [Penicillium roqueforti]KAI1835259.1 hypothetical protein CBS147337_4076 [Penicillium roqueforti]KAI2677272.1 hypothetical protein CBS147355_5499 [Penicillium roqueforti]KAI2720010.1 hypothetical protein CBS147318_3316 [Penicillium roqueforti]KAI2720502.1 hypothetical protein CBS147354_5943 [Penicillium roqueforti]
MSASELLQARNETTTRLYADPHNPHLHLERGIQYEKLGFPDLASADSYRALALLESVVDPDECEFHARRKIDPSQQAPKTVANESDDEDEDNSTVPITQEEYDAIIDQVYVLLVRSLVRCGCYRDAFEFGVRGLALLEKRSATASVAALNVQMDRVKEIYKSRNGSETENIDLDSIDPSVLPAQGFARRVLYPWNGHEPDRRSPETLKILNERLAVIAPKCEVRAVALPVLHASADDDSSGMDVSVQLGLFAKEDIAPDEIILRESSLLTATNRLHDDLCDACNAPLPELSAAEPPVACEGGCVDIIFCSQACHDTAQEVYHGAICGLEDGLDSIGKDVPDPKDKADYLYLLLLGRALAMSATQDKHPLDLPEMKYIWGDFHDLDIESVSAETEITPTTDDTATLPFSFQLNVLQPERFLDEMGLDPYVALYRYDTWVLNTLFAKFRGTASGRLSTWDGGPELCAVHPLWCLANHSCDPNVTWEWSSEINFRVRRDDETAVWSRGLEMKELRPGVTAVTRSVDPLQMSDLQKSFAKSKLAKFPPEAPMPESMSHSEDAWEDGSSASSLSSTGTMVPSPTRQLFARTGRRQSSQTSLTWTDFFDQELFLPEDVDNLHILHHVYLTPPTGSGPLFVMHHGAGSSGLSFATCAEEIRKILPKAGILSLDARSHGRTVVTTLDSEIDDGAPSTAAAAQVEASGNVELDLSLETLSRDLVHVIYQTQARMGWENLPDIVLVGHSLGGAVITDVAKRGELGQKLLAYAVFDVVEGSAMDALQSMEKYLSTRPTRFPSLLSGIEWHTRSRTIRNTTSARASVPSLLYEESEPSDPSRPWVWRTNLSATKPFWENWFVGLSRKFLDARGGKLLLLAGTDRLDKELMIGQMQGKYQLQVFPEAGHFVHEDQPAKTAQILADFYRRNDRSALVLPPKVADMQASAAMKKGTGAPGGSTAHQR